MSNEKQSFQVIKSFNKEELESFIIGVCGQPRSSEKEALEILEFIFLSNELSVKPDIHVNNDDILRVAATAGNVKIVQFLLTDPRLKEKSDIKAHRFSAYRRACAGQYSLPVLKFMLETPEIRAQIDLTTENHNALIRAFRNNRTENIDYLLWNAKYPVDDNLKKVLLENGNKAWVEYIENFLNMKEKEEFKKQLNQNLSNEKPEGIKIKI